MPVSRTCCCWLLTSPLVMRGRGADFTALYRRHPASIRRRGLNPRGRPALGIPVLGEIHGPWGDLTTRGGGRGRLYPPVVVTSNLVTWCNLTWGDQVFWGGCLSTDAVTRCRGTTARAVLLGYTVQKLFNSRQFGSFRFSEKVIEFTSRQ